MLMADIVILPFERKYLSDACSVSDLPEVGGGLDHQLLLFPLPVFSRLPEVGLTPSDSLPKVLHWMTP